MHVTCSLVVTSPKIYKKITIMCVYHMHVPCSLVVTFPNFNQITIICVTRVMLVLFFVVYLSQVDDVIGDQHEVDDVGAEEKAVRLNNHIIQQQQNRVHGRDIGIAVSRWCCLICTLASFLAQNL